MRILLPLLFLVTTSSAQILNPGFETWTIGGLPENWYGFSVPTIATPITKSTTAHSGSAAVRGEVVSYVTAVIGPALQGGSTAEGFSYTGRPARVQGYYQFTPKGTDKFSVNVIIYKGGVSGTAVATAAAAFTTATSGWTLFDIPFTYVSSVSPDICVPQFMIFNSAPGNPVTLGSVFLLDDIALVGTATAVGGTDVQTPTAFELKQNYPNPFNPSTTISYGLPAAGRVQMKVYDRLGTEIATLVDRDEVAGSHSVRFAANGLASGAYFVALRHNGRYAVRPMLLVK